MLDFLQDIVVVDLSSRLPGPFSTFLLQHLGAKVYKLEDAGHAGDAFLDLGQLKYAPNFLDWYRNLNQCKKIISLDFQTEQTKLQSYLQEANIILVPDNRYYNELLKNFSFQEKVIIKIAGGKNHWKYLHDLNAIGASRSFQQQPTPPLPFLPFAGINLGHYLASFSLSALRKSEINKMLIEETIFLKDVTTFIFDLFHSELINSDGKFLHTGAFPCYNLYQTSDRRTICFAAIEEKYWKEFQKIFSVEFSLEDRFDLSGKVYHKIQKVFAKLDSHEVEKRILNHHICITVAK